MSGLGWQELFIVLPACGITLLLPVATIVLLVMILRRLDTIAARLDDRTGGERLPPPRPTRVRPNEPERPG